jgi:hypothetical protein
VGIMAAEVWALSGVERSAAAAAASMHVAKVLLRTVCILIFGEVVPENRSTMFAIEHGLRQGRQGRPVSVRGAAFGNSSGLGYLVEWSWQQSTRVRMNQVDVTYRSEFRELFEVNFARFDAKLEQRIAEVRAEFRQELAGLETRLIRWMFLFWIGTIGTMIALLKFWSG